MVTNYLTKQYDMCLMPQTHFFNFSRNLKLFFHVSVAPETIFETQNFFRPWHGWIRVRFLWCSRRIIPYELALNWDFLFNFTQSIQSDVVTRDQLSESDAKLLGFVDRLSPRAVVYNTICLLSRIGIPYVATRNMEYVSDILQVISRKLAFPSDDCVKN